jgi:hypothetical protein
METQTPSSAAVKPGLILGLIGIVITYLGYFIDSSLLASGSFGFLSIVIFFALIIYFGIQYRKSIGGFMDFSTSFKFSFIAILISGIISFIGQILLFHVIDPSLSQVLADAAFENSLKMVELVGQNADSMPVEAIDKLRETSQEAFSLSGQIKNFGFGLISYAVIALILAAILKKRDKSLDY